MQIIHPAPARLGGVELARPGIMSVVAALAPSPQVSLVVVRLVLVHVRDRQADLRAGVRVGQVIPRPAVGLLAAVAGALQDTLAQRLPFRAAQAAARTEALPVGPDGYRLFLCCSGFQSQQGISLRTLEVVSLPGPEPLCERWLVLRRIPAA